MLIGIVGKPSAGKSTFFKSITLAEVGIASYPFTTIKPNEGVGFVRVPCVDKDLNTQCNPREGYCVNHIRFVPVKLLDVAGLVPDAHLGKGLGLQFLDDLRTADVLIHIVDASGSTNERGEAVDTGSHDPSHDIRFLEHELDMWVLGIAKKGWEKFVRALVQEKGKVVQALTKQLSGLNVQEDDVKEALRKLKIDENPEKWGDEELMRLAQTLRKMTKPILIAANKADSPVAQKNIEKLKKDFPDLTIVPCSAAAELALKEGHKNKILNYIPGEKTFEVTGQVNPAQSKGLEFIRKNVLEVYGSTGVQQVLDTAVFQFLKYVAIFPGGLGKLGDQYGRILPDCFLLPHGSTALDFAFKIHSDLGNNFIRAIDVKTRKVIGKEHVLQHRDVIEIVSSK